MMRLTNLLFLAVFCVLITHPTKCDPTEDRAIEVRKAETAFARTMADRDLEAFLGFVADEAVFFGQTGAMRGVESVKAAWRPYFAGTTAPFSWKPEVVEVLESGDLAFSSGPVFDPQGRRVGTFNSIWRRDAKGNWRVVFDKGCPPCDCSPKPTDGDGSP